MRNDFVVICEWSVLIPEDKLLTVRIFTPERDSAVFFKIGRCCVVKKKFQGDQRGNAKF